jgi:hypothetical protein
MRFASSVFFHNSTAPRPLVNILKYFRISFRIRGDFRPQTVEKIDSALSNIAGSHDSALCSIAHIREYLREFETEFENILGYYSGAKGQLIYEKNQRSNIS